MFALDLDCKQEEKDLLIAELWEEGSAGIAEVNDAGLRAFFADDSLAADLLHRFAHRGARLGEVEQRDWVAFSRAKWEPFEVGSRFFLVPRWRTDPAPAGRLRIEINPGLA